jgi:surface antigen
MSQSLLRIALLTVCLALVSQATWAQSERIFGSVGLPLTETDFAMMAKAVDPLLNDDSLALGTSREWRNASTGAQGTVTLLQKFNYDYQGSKLPCRKLKYHVLTRNSSNPYNAILDRCRVADGSWKILSF